MSQGPFYYCQKCGEQIMIHGNVYQPDDFICPECKCKMDGRITHSRLKNERLILRALRDLIIQINDQCEGELLAALNEAIDDLGTEPDDETK